MITKATAKPSMPALYEHIHGAFILLATSRNTVANKRMLSGVIVHADPSSAWKVGDYEIDFIRFDEVRPYDGIVTMQN